jgi:C4-type Zn-finger protein
MNKKPDPVGRLSWELYVDCPECDETFDAVDVDAENDYVIAKQIFSNNWDAVAGCDITCPSCGHEFQMGRVEY